MNAKNDVQEPSTDVAVPDAVAREAKSSSAVLEAIQTLGNASAVWSTFKTETLEDKKKAYNAISDSEALQDHLRETLMLKDFVVQAATMIDDDGEELNVLRTILVTADGKAYHAISDGIFKALQNMTGLIGHPSEWPAEGIAVTVQEVKGRRGFRFMTIKLA